MGAIYGFPPGIGVKERLPIRSALPMRWNVLVRGIPLGPVEGSIADATGTASLSKATIASRLSMTPEFFSRVCLARA
jgi:hypothetical protein